MTTYQICLAVNVEANDEDHAMEIAAALEAFLGMHHQTSTLGTVTEVIEVEDEDEDEFDNELDLPQDEDLVDEYDPMDDVNYVGHPTHY